MNLKTACRLQKKVFWEKNLPATVTTVKPSPK